MSRLKKWGIQTAENWGILDRRLQTLWHWGPKAEARKYYNDSYRNMQDTAEIIKVKFIGWLLR
ncbi:MAG: hypothetical protein Q8O90_02325, partial [Elusimicrobiota bacterium]|nr:hypothetical protein [Elusimicrobiota bacterium]